MHRPPSLSADNDGGAPRVRDSARTKAAILEAAAIAFSTVGYGNAGVREIAACAGVNSTLIARYFGSKERLFEEALRRALPVETLFDAGRARFGAHVAAILTAEVSDSQNVVAMAILATGHPAASAIVTRLYEELVVGALAAWLGGVAARSRAARITALCTGFVTYRKLLPLSDLHGAGEAMAASWLAQSLQALVDEDGTRGDRP